MMLLFDTPFSADTYDTPDHYPRSVWEYVLLGTRLSFYLRNFAVFARVGSIAKAGKLTPELQSAYSVKNIRITESCGGKIHLRGLDHLSAFPEPAVIIGNHMSLLETALMHAFVRPRRDFCFVIKRSLLDVPFFGNIMRSLKCIPVDRVNPRDDFRAVMEIGTERLKEGKSVIIFPQSTRSTVFDPSQFNTIGVKLAKHAGAPVIPLALRTDFLNNGRLVKDLGPICRGNPVWFEFGEPIMKIAGTGRDEHAQIIRFIADRVRAWGGQVREEKE
ncbi:MAG: 1-acyl-sn-glycerol-3-phosphate acyltransferase [Lentisphaeria bacterium]|nr:1-acyl-sn-glycerol-3-phosphate acyltransferase [Lentisphaeria bacterium]